MNNKYSERIVYRLADARDLVYWEISVDGVVVGRVTHHARHDTSGKVWCHDNGGVPRRERRGGKRDWVYNPPHFATRHDAAAALVVIYQEDLKE